MRRLVLLLTLVSAVSFSQEEIALPKAPSEIPNAQEDLNEKLSNSLNNTTLQGFVNDPNYALSDFSWRFEYIKDELVSSFLTEGVMDKLYEWALPGLKQKWVTLNLFEKAEVKSALFHISAFCEAYNHDAETDYLNKLEAMFRTPMYLNGRSHPYTLHYKYLFVRYDKGDYLDGDLNKPLPWEAKSKYRRLEAFVYRRVEDGVDAKMMGKYFGKLNGELILKDGPQTYKDDEREQTGTIKNGLREGVWIEKRKNNDELVEIYRGNYSSGKKDGEFKIIYFWSLSNPKANTLDEVWKDGKLVSYAYKGYNREGELASTDDIDMTKGTRVVYSKYYDETRQFIFNEDYHYEYPNFKMANDDPSIVYSLRPNGELTTIPELSQYTNLEIVDFTAAKNLDCAGIPAAMEGLKNIKKIVLPSSCDQEVARKLMSIFPKAQFIYI